MVLSVGGVGAPLALMALGFAPQRHRCFLAAFHQNARLREGFSHLALLLANMKQVAALLLFLWTCPAFYKVLWCAYVRLEPCYES